MPPNLNSIAEPEDDTHDSALAAEVRFLDEWASGNLPFLGALVRVRQIYRAHPLIFDHGR